MAGNNKPDRFTALVHPGSQQPEGTYVDDDAPLPVKITGSGGGSSSVTVLDVKDGAGDSVMDAANNAIRIVVIGGVAGTKSNNAGAPGNTNLGTLPAVATAVKPSYAEGNQVALSVRLNGGLRVTGIIPDDGVTNNASDPVFVGGEDSAGLGRGFRVADAPTLPKFRTLAVAQYVHDPNLDTWVRRVGFQGTHGNAWDAAATGADGVSAAIDCQHQAFVSVIGKNNSGVTSTITLEVSQNGTNYFLLTGYGAVTVGSVFKSDHTSGHRFFRLRSSANTNVTANIAAKTG